MTWREWVLSYLQEEKTDIKRRIELFESGKCQMHEMRNGQTTDITGELLERLNRNLVEIEAIMTEAGLRPNA